MKFKSALALIYLAVLTMTAQKGKEPKTEFTKMNLPVWIEARDH